MQTNIMICGVGGQGIVLTSKLIAATAVAKNVPVMSAETIGMAQKGGSVFSFLRLGDGIESPIFPEGTADLLIGFEPSEAVRMFPYLKKGGTAIVNTHPIMPVTAALTGSDYDGADMLDYLKQNAGKTVFVDGEKACAEIGSAKVLNMVMLGAAVATGLLPFTPEEIEDTMKATVRPQFVELNSKALKYQA